MTFLFGLWFAYRVLPVLLVVTMAYWFIRGLTD